MGAVELLVLALASIIVSLLAFLHGLLFFALRGLLAVLVNFVLAGVFLYLVLASGSRLLLTLFFIFYVLGAFFGALVDNEVRGLLFGEDDEEGE